MALYWPYQFKKPKTILKDAPALDVRGLAAVYPHYREPTISNISFSIQPGQRVALVGPNGSGKSTLLKTLAGLLPVFLGEITAFGAPIHQMRHVLTYLAQHGDIDWSFPISLRNFVLAGRYIHLGWIRRPSKSDRLQLASVLHSLHLCDFAHKRIGELSGGQQQRALLARCLIQDAQLLFLDEPLNALDVETRGILTNRIQALSQAGKTILMSTHNIDSIQTDFDSALYLFQGRLMCSSVTESGPCTSHS